MKFILYLILFTILFSEDKYKEPSYQLLEKINNIEIRQYNEYIVAKTSIPKNAQKSDNLMFKTLASYIFGANAKQEKIPMTAPVSTYELDNQHNMLFYMLDFNDINDLPKTSVQNIAFEKINLGKCAVITFSWYTTKKKVNKYKNILTQFIINHGYTAKKPTFLNRYNAPWTLPFLRRNEILIKIN